jgi:Spy/CpxP family protein refolding chaperone
MLLRLRLAITAGVLLAAVLVVSSVATSAQSFGLSARTKSPAAPPQQGQAAGQVQPPRQGDRQPPSAQRAMGSDRDLWWRNETIRKELSLSERQMRDINWIFELRVKQATPILEAFERERNELNRLTRERAVDEAVYAVQVGRKESLHSKFNETRTVMLYQILRKLTPVQYQKLQETRPPTAQRNPGGDRDLWWRSEAIRKEVDVTERQMRDITWIFETSAKQATPVLEALQRERAELDRLTQERAVDEPVYAIQVGRMESLRAKYNETRTVMLYRILKKLTTAQYGKLQAIRDRNRGGSSPRSW